MSTKNRNIYSIIGPTAIGKSKIAIELVDKYPFEIISLDSSMIYREMNIGTDKPDSKILSKYKHHLIDIIDPNEDYNVFQYCKDINVAIKEIFKNKKIPLLVGGTMMYFNAIINGLDDIPKKIPCVKDFVSDLMNKYSPKIMHNCLKDIDHDSFLRINSNDQQRIERAIEVYISSGKPLSSFFKSSNNFFDKYEFINIKLYTEDRNYIHEKIKTRTSRMFEQGLIDEVKHILDKYPNIEKCQSMKSIGYKHIIEYLNNDLKKEDLIDRCIFATRQLAKRQFTWMKNFSFESEIEISSTGNILKKIEKNLHLEKLM
jgi:tRNA dimethylallyltransferase